MSLATILIVDDDEVLGGILRQVLLRQGYQVCLAAGAAQALELMQSHRPQLALLDLCLPDGDGLQLAGDLRALSPDLVLILMTAYPLRLRERPELAQEFAQVLTKPLDLAELRQVISERINQVLSPGV
jgi:DNA-binding NtrC family response regulator